MNKLIDIACSGSCNNNVLMFYRLKISMVLKTEHYIRTACRVRERIVKIEEQFCDFKTQFLHHHISLDTRWLVSDICILKMIVDGFADLQFRKWVHHDVEQWK